MPEYSQACSNYEELKKQCDTEIARNEEQLTRAYVAYLDGQNEFPEPILRKRQKELQELVDKSISGMKVGGFNSARLLLGGFKNDELGSYTSFVYTGKSPSIILRTNNDKIIVIALENAEDTTALYNEIASSIGEN